MLKKKIQRTFGFIYHHNLAKKSPFQAYCKFCIWQIQTFFNKGLIKKRFIGNVKFYAKKGLTGITGNIYTGLHEFEDMSFLLHFLRKEDTFFDIGANVGSYSLLASGYIGAKSLSFEPTPSTFAILKKNIDLNKLETKIFPYQIALAKETGYLNFSTNYDTGNHVLNNEELDTEATKVEVKPIDDFKDLEPELIKIDVEGFETQVLEGGAKLLNNIKLKAIIIELNGSGGRYGFDDTKIHHYLINLGFKPYAYYPFNRKLIELEKFGQFNTIYIRDLEFVRNRLNSAVFIAINGIRF